MAKNVLNPRKAEPFAKPKKKEDVVNNGNDTPDKDAVAAVGQELNNLMTAATESIDASLEASLGHQLGTLFEAVDRAFLQPGFGGLQEIPEGAAQDIVDFWVDKLQHLADRGHFAADVIPKTFLCRMLPDGSLFMKRVNLPRGVVLSRDESLDSLDIPAPPQTPAPASGVPARAPVVQPEEQPESKQPKAAKTLSLGPGGVLQVKKEE